MVHNVARPHPAPPVRHASRSPQTSAQAYAALASWFTARGWTPGQVRAAEQAFGTSTPVAAAMTSPALAAVR
jgi:hypothetical protein